MMFTATINIMHSFSAHSNHLSVFHCVKDCLNIMNAWSLPLGGPCDHTCWLAEACKSLLLLCNDIVVMFWGHAVVMDVAFVVMVHSESACLSHAKKKKKKNCTPPVKYDIMIPMLAFVASMIVEACLSLSRSASHTSGAGLLGALSNYVAQWPPQKEEKRKGNTFRRRLVIFKAAPTVYAALGHVGKDDR